MAKIDKTDYQEVLIIVQNSLNQLCETFGLTFEIVNIQLYGSQVTSKKHPNDIDVFVQISGIVIVDRNQFLGAYGPTVDKITADDLMAIGYEWLHDNQPTYKETPVDINFRDYEFDMDGKLVILL